MEIVGAFGCSHSGLIITRRDPDAEGEQKAFFQAFERMGTEILALEPKAIIVIGTDHGRIFDLKHVPQFTLGVGKSVTSIGDAGLPVEEIRSRASSLALFCQVCCRRALILPSRRQCQ